MPQKTGLFLQLDAVVFLNSNASLGLSKLKLAMENSPLKPALTCWQSKIQLAKALAKQGTINISNKSAGNPTNHIIPQLALLRLPEKYEADLQTTADNLKVIA